MSTEVTAETAAEKPKRRCGIRTSSLRTARVLRFAFGVTLAVALAFGYEWPLSFLTPIFTGLFLSLPLPAPTFGHSLKNCVYALEGFLLGLVFTLFLLPFPLIYIPMLGLVLFHIYYYLNRGGSVWRVLMHLIAVLILPMLGQLHDIISEGFALYFIYSSVLAILLSQLAHGLLPDPPGGPKLPPGAGFNPGYSPAAAQAAMKSTIIVLPLATLFIWLGWTGQLLILVFSAIFSLSPALSAGKAAAAKSLTSTVLGGLSALAFYWLIVAVPEFHFFIALMLLTTLLFAMGIFSDAPYAKYLSSAFTALLILVGSSMGEGVSIVDKFVGRVVLISLAALYIVAGLSVLNAFLFRKQADSNT